MTGEQVEKEDLNRDYVASAYVNPGSKELRYIDSKCDNDCYGRYANDPIDDQLVNAKILMIKGEMVLVAMVDIEPGDEIYLSYVGEYWYTRWDRLEHELQKKVKRNYPGEPKVTFRGENEAVTLPSSETVSVKNWSKKWIKKGVIMQQPSKNRLTRLREMELEKIREELKDQNEEEKRSEMDIIRVEDYEHENVNQCEELADELRLILERRKFIDNDNNRLYEIHQVRYDEDSGTVIGFRKPLSGIRDAEDDFAYLVYGKDGLYELSERYLIDHPNERNETTWPTSKRDWMKEQEADPECREIMDKIRGSEIKETTIGNHTYTFMEICDEENEILVKKVMSNNGWIKQCVVPPKLRRLALQIHHEGLSHFGAGRMKATMKRNYFWSTMDRDVEEHVKSCVNCKLRKPYQRRPRVPLVHYGPATRILDRVHMDLTGPLPVTRDGHKYILVIKDFLSKYVWLTPLQDKTKEEVALAFVNDFICQAGIPNMVVSDKGNEFVNKIMKEVARILNILKISTTPYNPRADGFVENHNKTLKDQLYHYIDTLHQKDWDIYLPVIQLMYNTTVSLSTGYTPMLLMTGREAKMPSHEFVEDRSIFVENEVIDSEYVQKMVTTMRAYQDFAVEHAGRNKEEMSVRVRRPLEFKEYEPGQLFLRTRRPVSKFISGTSDEKEQVQISMKLLERYEGPYKIIRKISPILYDCDINGKEVRLHAVNMKPY